MVNDLADDQKCGIGQRLNVGRKPRFGAVDDALLLRETPFRDHGDGRVGLGELNEVLGDVADASAAHEDHERGGGAEGGHQVGGQSAILSRGGAEPSRRGHASKRERNASQSCKRRPTRDARHVSPA